MEEIKHRPYMFITFIQRPSPGSKTNDPTWKENGTWEVTEKMVISDYPKSRMMLEASVVIDLLNTKVVKNRNGDLSDVSCNEYFARYYVEIVEALKVWAKKRPENLDALRKFNAWRT